MRWQTAHGWPVSLPSRATFGDIALLLYAGLMVLDLLFVWRWSSLRWFAQNVFLFHRLNVTDTAIGVTGFVIAMYGVPAVNDFLSHATHSHSVGRGPNLHYLLPLTAYILGAVVVPPVGKEILYHDLLVWPWFRRLGWPFAAP